MAGIVSYGYYIPKYRISTEEIAKTWGKNAQDIQNSLNIFEKAVASSDEDVLTMAYGAASMALSDVSVKKNEIGCVFFGSETFPYAVKPAASMVAEWLDIGNDYLSYDTEFACKAGTGALLSALSHVSTGKMKYGLVCAADKSNAKPQDALEFTAGSGANAWLVGTENVLAEIIDYQSYSSDTPDFWRRPYAAHPSHAGRFTGKPAYMLHIAEASKRLLEKHAMKPSDFTRCIFHMPNGRFPLEISRALGFTKDQIIDSLVVPQLGNSYSASALMGLVATLEVSHPGDVLFFASYGSGAGSDAMIIKVTDEIEKRRRVFKKLIENKEYISYPTYMRYMGML